MLTKPSMTESSAMILRKTLFLLHEKKDLPLLIKIAEYKSSQPNYDVIITNWPAAFHYMPNNFFIFIRNKIFIQYFQNYLDCFLKPITLYVRNPRRQTAHVNPIG